MIKLQVINREQAYSKILLTKSWIQPNHFNITGNNTNILGKNAVLHCVIMYLNNSFYDNFTM